MARARYEGWLRVRVDVGDRAEMVKEAERDGVGLSDWVRGTLRRVLDEEGDARRVRVLARGGPDAVDMSESFRDPPDIREVP